MKTNEAVTHVCEGHALVIVTWPHGRTSSPHLHGMDSFEWSRRTQQYVYSRIHQLSRLGPSLAVTNFAFVYESMYMEICHFINGIGNAGAENLLTRIVETADTDDTSYTVLYLGTYHDLTDRIEAAGGNLICLDARTDPPQLDPALPVRFARVVRQHDFDIVHTHNPYTHILARTIGKALGDFEVISTQHLVKDALNPIASVGGDLTRSREDASIAVSQGVQQSFTGEVSLYSESGLQDEWCTVYNGIQVDQFNEAVAAAQPPDYDSDKLSFVNVGRYTPQKCQQVLVDAMPMVTDVHPHAQLYLVGSSGGLEDSLRERANRQGVSDSVIITGFVPEIEPYYALADVFVSSSVSEGLPMTILEAMSSELPVIGTNIPGVTEVIIDGESGHLVPPHEPSAMAEAMISMADVETRRQFGKRGYELAKERFDIRQTVSSYHDLYTECLAGGN